MITRLQLGPTDQGRPLTWDEYLTAHYREGYRYEFIRGRLEVSPLPNFAHDRLLGWLVDHLRAYAKACPEVINYVAGPARVFPEPETEVSAPEPDLAAFRDVPLDLPLDEVRWEDLTAVLVAEIVSEETAEKDFVRNVELYLKVPSIREYWILDPRESHDTPTLTVYRRRGRGWQRPIVVPFGETYTTPRLLPGFSLRLDPRA